MAWVNTYLFHVWWLLNLGVQYSRIRKNWIVELAMKLLKMNKRFEDLFYTDFFKIRSPTE